MLFSGPFMQKVVFGYVGESRDAGVSREIVKGV